MREESITPSLVYNSCMDATPSVGVGKIELNIEGTTKEEVTKYQEVLSVLISSGALRLKNGKAVLHFDSDGTFQGVQLDYWAFKRRKEEK